jgi:hypothetical protein
MATINFAHFGNFAHVMNIAQIRHLERHGISKVTKVYPHFHGFD